MGGGGVCVLLFSCMQRLALVYRYSDGKHANVVRKRIAGLRKKDIDTTCINIGRLERT